MTRPGPHMGIVGPYHPSHYTAEQRDRLRTVAASARYGAPVADPRREPLIVCVVCGENGYVAGYCRCAKPPPNMKQRDYEPWSFALSGEGRRT